MCPRLADVIQSNDRIPVRSQPQCAAGTQLILVANRAIPCEIDQPRRGRLRRQTATHLSLRFCELHISRCHASTWTARSTTSVTPGHRERSDDGRVPDDPECADLSPHRSMAFAAMQKTLTTYGAGTICYWALTHVHPLCRRRHGLEHQGRRGAGITGYHFDASYAHH